MRKQHVIAAVAVVLFVGGVKAAQVRNFHAQYGDGPRLRVSTWSVEELRNVGDLPVQQVHDMSFVFADGELTAGGITAATSAEPGITRRCAERDLRAATVIEEFGQIDGMPSAWLADAGLNWLQARSYCLSGAENEGIKLYDRIIAGETRMPNAWTMSEWVRQ